VQKISTNQPARLGAASQLASLTSKLPTWFLNLALQQWKSVNHATNTIRNSIRKFILAKKYQAKCR